MEGGANPIAWLAIVLALPVSIGLVRVWRVAVAVPVIILLGQMFLPPVIALDAPLIPPMGKEILVPMGALIGCFLFRRRILADSRPFRGYDLFIVLRMVGIFGTYMTNGDMLQFGPVVLPAISFYDFFTNVFKEIIFWWPVFFLGRTVIRTQRDLRDLFRILVGAGVVYSGLHVHRAAHQPAAQPDPLRLPPGAVPPVDARRRLPAHGLHAPRDQRRVLHGLHDPGRDGAGRCEGARLRRQGGGRSRSTSSSC